MWKDITVILNQTLSDPEHARVLKEAQSYAMLGFPCGSAGKEFTCNAGDLGSIPRLRRSPEEGQGYPVQYSGLENFKDCIVHGVTKSQTQVSNFHFTLLVPFDVQSLFDTKISFFL